MRMLAVCLLICCLGVPGQGAEFARKHWVGDGPLVFPDGSFERADDATDLRLNRHYSAVARRLVEGPLTDARDSGALMRLIALRARSTPFVFTVTRNETAFFLDFKLGWGPAEAPGGVESEDRFDLAPDMFLAILEATNAMELCTRPPEGMPSARTTVWILESLNGPYCLHAFHDPAGEAFTDLLAALTTPLRGLPGVVRRERERAGSIGE